MLGLWSVKERKATWRKYPTAGCSPGWSEYWRTLSVPPVSPSWSRGTSAQSRMKKTCRLDHRLIRSNRMDTGNCSPGDHRVSPKATGPGWWPLSGSRTRRSHRWPSAAGSRRGTAAACLSPSRTAASAPPWPCLPANSDNDRKRKGKGKDPNHHITKLMLPRTGTNLVWPKSGRHDTGAHIVAAHHGNQHRRDHHRRAQRQYVVLEAQYDRLAWNESQKGFFLKKRRRRKRFREPNSSTNVNSFQLLATIRTPGRVWVYAVLEPLELLHGRMAYLLRLHLRHFLPASFALLDQDKPEERGQEESSCPSGSQEHDLVP